MRPVLTNFRSHLWTKCIIVIFSLFFSSSLPVTVPFPFKFRLNAFYHSRSGRGRAYSREINFWRDGRAGALREGRRSDGVGRVIKNKITSLCHRLNEKRIFSFRTLGTRSRVGSSSIKPLVIIAEFTTFPLFPLAPLSTSRFRDCSVLPEENSLKSSEHLTICT